jgi:nucleoid-associated protein YgaU
MTDASDDSEGNSESDESPTTGSATDGGHHPEHTGDDPPPEQWQFDVEDVDKDGVIKTTIEPESVDWENAVFVVLGVVLALLILVRTVTVFA